MAVLTEFAIKAAKTKNKEYTLKDGSGLFLNIHPNGSKYWLFRFSWNGKQSGVDFAIMQSSDIIISIFLTVIAGVLVDCFSYIILFSLSAILGIIGLIYLFRQTTRLSSINNN